MTELPAVLIGVRGANLSQTISLPIEMSGTDAPDIAIVVDIYAMDNPVHPAGHIGWWKFMAGQLTSPCHAKINRDRTNLSVSIEGQVAVDSWINPAPPIADRLVLNVVLRSNATNALLAADRIPLLDSEDALTALWQDFDRSWTRPTLAVSPYVFPKDHTIHVVAPTMHRRDAVGNLCLDLYRLFKQNGVKVRMFSDSTDLSLSDLIEPQSVLGRRAGADDHILYFSSTFDPHLPSIADLPQRKTAYFHGITDPQKLRVFDPELASHAARGLTSLPILSRFDQLATNSLHSAKILAGFLNCDVAKLSVIAPKLLAASPSVAEPAGRSGSQDLLYVGQLNPHKRVEDVLRLFKAYRQLVPSSICHVVGRPRHQAYRDYLGWVENTELNLPEGSVLWHGGVSDGELRQLYRTAGALVSMSEDEGFCLPLMEAMGHGALVFAFGIEAVRETMGGAGVIFSSKQFEYLAQELSSLLGNDTRREAILREQDRRYKELAARMTGREFFELLQPLWPEQRKDVVPRV